MLTAHKFLLVLLFSNGLSALAQRGGGGSSVGTPSLGSLSDYLFVFTDGSVDANWQGAFVGLFIVLAVYLERIRGRSRA